MTKNELEQLIGPFPEKVKLAPEILESEDCGNYIREKVEYSVESDDRVRAYVLIPKNRNKKLPAIFCHHQHAADWSVGKSEVVGLAGDPDMVYAHELAERGYVTFAPDAMMFEERNWAKEFQKVPTHANSLELTHRLVRGQTLLAKVLHDVMVGIDYLTSREEVDPERVGFIGHSYGGRMALWAPVFDERIKASVSNCGCDSYNDSANREAGILPEFVVPDIMNHGDLEDILKLACHCNILISATDSDRWSRGAEALYEKAQPAFTNTKLELKIYPGGHQFTKPMRDHAYAFFQHI